MLNHPYSGFCLPLFWKGTQQPRSSNAYLEFKTTAFLSLQAYKDPSKKQHKYEYNAEKVLRTKTSYPVGEPVEMFLSM